MTRAATGGAFVLEPSVRARIAARLDRPVPADTVAGWVGPAAVFLVALLMRLHRLGDPRVEVFDELYYACEARSLLRHGYEVVTRDRAAGFCVEDATVAHGDFVVHPPLGKWMIAVGELLFGFNSFGWRFSAAVVGSLSVLVLARVGRRMLRSTLLGCIAAALMAFDGLHFVQSRVAMLDVFLMFWVLAAFGCLVVDRDHARACLAARLDHDRDGAGPRLGLRPWRVGAGVCLGAAVATKWSALYFVVALGALTFAWDVGARRAGGFRRPILSTLRRDGAPLVSSLLVVASLVYVTSWAGWFASDDAWRRSTGAMDAGVEDPHHHGALRGFVEYHEEIWTFHQGLRVDHAYESRPETWFLLVRPVAYYYPPDLPPGESRAVLAVGTPPVWWAAIPASVALAWAWVSRRDWRASALLVVVLGGYLPWFLERDRTMFLFYALPLVPFLALGLAYCAGLAVGGAAAPPRRRWAGAVAVGAYVGVVAWTFLHLHPVLTGQPIPYDEWRDRMLFATWI